MSNFILKYDIGDNVKVNIAGQCHIAKISGLSASRNDNGDYSITYDVKWLENGIEKVEKVSESEVSAVKNE